MSYLFHAIVYTNDSPYFDILLKSNNYKIALWYLIRLYYEKKRDDLFESFLFIKIKNLLQQIKNPFQFSFSKFIFQNKSLLSLLLYLLSNDIITLNNIYKWTLEFNTIYPSSSILIKKRQVFDTTSRTFSNTLNSNEYFLNHKNRNLNTNHFLLSDNKIESSLDYLKSKITPSNSQIITYKPNKNLKLQKFIPSYLNDQSLIDKYLIWKDNDRFSKYTINTLLLDNNKLALKTKK